MTKMLNIRNIETSNNKILRFTGDWFEFAFEENRIFTQLRSTSDSSWGGQIIFRTVRKTLTFNTNFEHS